MPSRPTPSSFQPDPLSTAAIVVGLIGVIASMVLKSPGWLLIVGLGLIFFGIAWYANERTGSQLRQAAREVMASARADESKPEAKLRRELVQLKYDPAKSADAAEIESALSRLEASYYEFSKMLSSRLEPGEMTFERFAVAGAEVKNAAVRGLAQGASALASGALSATRVSASGNQLRLPGGSGQGVRSGSLVECIERNERAVNGLKKMSESLLAMRGVVGDPSRDLDQALNDLRDLAARAKKY